LKTQFHNSRTQSQCKAFDSDVVLAKNVAGIGAGTDWVLTVQILKAAGCRLLGADLDPGKCQLARELGGDEAVNDEA